MNLPESQKKSSQSKHLKTEEAIYFFDEMELACYPTLLCLSGVQAGSIYSIATNEAFVVGREKETSNIFIDSPEISRQHARIVKKLDQRLYLLDCESTNGVFVNNQKVTSYALQPNDKIRFGPHSVWKFFYQDAEEHEYYQQMFSNAYEDHLTGAMNRRRYMDLVERELAFARRTNRPLSFAIFDLDHFKSINDTYGHAAGDQVLREFVYRIQQNIRCEDVFCRYGGEEFSLMLRESSVELCYIVLDRLRSVVASTPFVTDAGPINVTTSIGCVSCQPENMEGFTPDDFFKHADELLYQAKNEGRNRVCLSEWPT